MCIRQHTRYGIEDAPRIQRSHLALSVVAAERDSEQKNGGQRHNSVVAHQQKQDSLCFRQDRRMKCEANKDLLLASDTQRNVPSGT